MTVTESEQNTDGIFLLNKPQGMTSNVALQKVKRLFSANKAGHAGCLDPLATGMLPVCLGEATKICQYLLDENKAYSTTGLLGIKTNTADSTGQIIASTDTFSISEAALRKVLEQFTGTIKQVPSMFSALKHKGAPLYRYARKGIEIEREAREVCISQLELDDFDGKSFSLTISCSKGTYIRNLVEDIGEALGVGAHLTRLHRLHTSGFEESAMHTLEALEAMSTEQRKAMLIPMDRVVQRFDAIMLTDSDLLRIRQGRVITTQASLIESPDTVRLYAENGNFVGLGERRVNGDIKAKRLLAFNPEPIIR